MLTRPSDGAAGEPLTREERREADARSLGHVESAVTMTCPEHEFPMPCPSCDMAVLLAGATEPADA